MLVIFIKGDSKYSYLKCIRDDKTLTETKMPDQGIIPHDMIHYVVEKQLAFTGAFYGQLKAGASIDFTLEHNELSLSVADQTESLQSESLVEAMQSILWASNFDYNSFIYLTEKACENRAIPMPAVNKRNFLYILNECYQLSQTWKFTPKGGTISVLF